MKRIQTFLLCLLLSTLTGCDNTPHGTSARSVYLHGKNMLDHAKDQQAIDSFLSAIEIEPEFAEPYIELAGLYISRNELPQARSILEKLLAVNPNSAEAYYLLGKSCRLEGNDTEAEQHIRRAVALSAVSYDAALRQLAGLFNDTGRYGDAYKIYTHLISLNRYSGDTDGKQNARNYYEIGIILLYQKEPEKAAGAFRKALYFDESFLPAYMPLALLYIYLDSKESAMHCYTYLFNIQSSQAKQLYEIIKHTRTVGTFDEFFAKHRKEFLGKD